MNEGKVPLYVVEENGSVSPEAWRVQAAYSLAHGLLSKSLEISDAVSSIKTMAYALGPDRDVDLEERSKAHTFPVEAEAREELLKVAGLMKALNMRIWAVTRALGGQAQALAEKINLALDQNIDESLETFLKSDPVTDKTEA